MTLQKNGKQVEKFKVIDKITEFKKSINIYDPEPFLVTESDSWQRVYRFPFDTIDSSPTAKKYSGHSLGRIEWNIEPRKMEYDKTERRYYITQILVWAQQTRDKNYSGKIFGINCMVESLGGGQHPLYDYEVYALNQIWRTSPNPVTKTMIMGTYPPNGFDILEFDVSSSISLSPMYQSFAKMPKDESHYEKTKDVYNKVRKYTQ